MKQYVPGTLPEVMKTKRGLAVETLEAWRAVRRPEILDVFRNEVFGRAPERPKDLSFTKTSRDNGALNGAATLETYEASFSGPHGAFKFPFALFVPNGKTPCPATLLICNRSKEENMDLTRKTRTGFWPVESIIQRGYAACAFWVEDVDTDADDGSVHGVQPVFTPRRGENDWATLAAWAWGAMRVMDYLVTDSRVDSERVAVVGQSRGGKTSLYCAAMDERFSAVYSSNSGCVGSALSRLKDGETLRQINETFPYWFCGAFKKYNDRQAELPFDQHELMACIAPRLLYVSASTLDAWADPEAEWLGTKLAGSAYALYGYSEMPVQTPMAVDSPCWGERIGFHNRTGEHDLTERDWMWFLDFLDAKQR